MHDVLRCHSRELATMLREKGVVAPPEVDHDPDLGETRRYAKEGVQIRLANDQVVTIFLFGVSDQDYQAFAGPPYENIEWNDTFEDVQVKLGEPTRFNDGNPDSEFGPILPWLRYDLENYTVHFEFQGDKERLRKVTFMVEAP